MLFCSKKEFQLFIVIGLLLVGSLVPSGAWGVKRTFSEEFGEYRYYSNKHAALASTTDREDHRVNTVTPDSIFSETDETLAMDEEENASSSGARIVTPIQSPLLDTKKSKVKKKVQFDVNLEERHDYLSLEDENMEAEDDELFSYMPSPFNNVTKKSSAMEVEGEENMDSEIAGNFLKMNVSAGEFTSLSEGNEPRNLLSADDFFGIED